MANIITLTGPAHCGKSTIRQMFLECENEYFRPAYISKYTTRSARKNDEDVYCVDRIPKECDLVYEQYGVRYGFELDKLYQLLEVGKTAIVVINDIRVLEDLKAAFGSLVVSIFIYRKAAVYEEFYAEEEERASKGILPDEIAAVARTRYEKAQAIYRIYIENIQLFDKVILNTFEKDDTKGQILNIVGYLIKELNGLKEDINA